MTLKTREQDVYRQTSILPKFEVGTLHAWNMTRYGDTINERAVRILLECILVVNCLCKVLEDGRLLKGMQNVIYLYAK